MTFFRRKKVVLLVLLTGVLVFLAGMKTELLLTVDARRHLMTPRFTPDGDRILFVEREARGVAFGPGIEFFTPPARLHVISDTYALREMDLDGKGLQTHFTWTMPRTQFWIPSYRNHLFGYPKIDLDIRGNRLALRCKINEVRYPRSIEHQKAFWWHLEEGRFIDAADYEAGERGRPWHRHRLSGPWEVMSYRYQAIFLERFEDGVSREIRFLRDTRKKPLTEAMLQTDLPYIRQRPKLEKLEAARKIRKQLVDTYVAAGDPPNTARMKAIDDLQDMGLTPKSKRIVARALERPLDAVPVFTISDREFAVGLFQDIDQAIAAPGKEIRFWGHYVRHRDFDTAERLNEHLRHSREFQVRTSRGVFAMKILY